MKLNSWRGIGSDGDVLLTPCVPEGITGYEDDDDDDDDDDDESGRDVALTTYPISRRG